MRPGSKSSAHASEPKSRSMPRRRKKRWIGAKRSCCGCERVFACWPRALKHWPPSSSQTRLWDSSASTADTLWSAGAASASRSRSSQRTPGTTRGAHSSWPSCSFPFPDSPIPGMPIGSSHSRRTPTCCGSRPVAARPRPISVSRPSPWPSVACREIWAVTTHHAVWR
ncbi:hypothetical protein FQZ97_1006560 [compost metagenome]